MDQAFQGQTCFYSVWATLPAAMPWAKPIEKQVGPTYETQSEAEFAMKHANVPGAKLEIRTHRRVDPRIIEAERAAKAAAEKATKAIRRAQGAEKAQHTRQITSIAKAMFLTGDETLANGLCDDDRRALIVKLAELKLDPAKAGKNESKDHPKYKPLYFAGLSDAIGVKIKIPNRPDDRSGLLDYANEVRGFKKLIESYDVLVSPNVGENALRRATYRNALRRLDLEIETCEMFGTDPTKTMPEWPIYVVAAKDEKAKAEDKPQVSEETKAKERESAHRRKVNSIVGAEIGHGKRPGPICQKNNYNYSGTWMRHGSDKQVRPLVRE